MNPVTFFFLFLFLSFIQCKERKYIVVISDCHIGGEWFVGRVRNALPKFLRQMTEPDTDVHTLVLNGDFLDFWMRNYTEYNPTPGETLLLEDYKGTNISEYVDIFKKLIKNKVRVIYVRGNHDIQMTREYLDQAGLQEVDFFPLYWDENPNFLIEHGHRFDLWCSPDPAETITPFGFLITRSYSEAGDFGGSTEQDTWNWACDHILSYLVEYISNAPWLYERVIGGAFGEKVWDEILNEKYQKHKHKDVKAGCVYFNWEDETLERAVRKYGDTVNRFIQKFGLIHTQNMIRGMCGDPDYFIERIGKQLYVQGHYHKADIRKYIDSKDLRKDIVYANTGAWTKYMEWLPFIRITQENYPKGNASYVELMEFNEINMEIIVKKESYVPYRESKEQRNEKTRIFENIKKVYDDNHNFNKFPPKIEKVKETPSGWTCDSSFYASDDGCDCDCGIPDPDCACVHGDVCKLSCCDVN